MIALPPDLVHALKTVVKQPKLLVAADFDGTMAPFNAEIMQVRALPESMAAVMQLAELPNTPTVILSGRDLESLRQLTDAQPPLRLTGSHGAQPDSDIAAGTGPTVALTPAQQQLMSDIETVFADVMTVHPDAWVERKPFARVFQTRALSERSPVLADELEHQVLAELRKLPGVFITAGNRSVEASVIHVTKGTWLAAEAKAQQADAVFYIGDCVTDERAFAVLTGPLDVSVRVHPDAPNADTAAKFQVTDIAAASEVLQLLAELRTEAVR